MQRDFSSKCRVCFHAATRHSMITFTAGELLEKNTPNPHDFIRKITGISSDEAYKHYQHIHKIYAEKAKKGEPEEILL